MPFTYKWGWGGGVVPLIFNSLFTALVLLEIVSNFQSLFPNPSHSIAMNFTQRARAGKVFRALEVNQVIIISIYVYISIGMQIFL